MPELPDVTVYVEQLSARVTGATLERVRLKSPFLLRSVEPPLALAYGRSVVTVARLGKRIVFALAGDLYLVLHLMIAGRLHFRQAGASLGQKSALAAFEFSTGSLVITEGGSKRRASLHAVAGVENLKAHHRGGLEPLTCSARQFEQRLRSENRTLKRALCAPHLVSGIGNAYSDEILHAAGLSPVTLTSRLDGKQMQRLHQATVDTLTRWTEILRRETGAHFPEKVTAFRPGMAVHGRFGQPCPRCGTRVQRIRHAENEVNYCPRCQTGGKLLADRSLSRLLGDDWPKTIEAWEEEHPLPAASQHQPDRSG